MILNFVLSDRLFHVAKITTLTLLSLQVWGKLSFPIAGLKITDQIAPIILKIIVIAK
jgi:hypothetical protein